MARGSPQARAPFLTLNCNTKGFSRRSSLIIVPVVGTITLFLVGIFLLLGKMWMSWSGRPSLLSVLGVTAPIATTTAVAEVQVDLSWHAPLQTEINDLEKVMAGSGVYGFIYNTSATPDEKYGVYNWCNMPHVRRREYPVPGQNEDGGNYELQYVEVIQRHHKRTPYASNAFPVEPYNWDCDDQALYKYGAPLLWYGPERAGTGGAPARVYWKGYTSEINPFVPSGWIGNCSFPQITAGGLEDSYVHGDNIYGVYHDLLGFLPSRDGDAGNGKDSAGWRDVAIFRVTQNEITSQVAGMLIAGLFNSTSSIPVLIQAEGIDSLEPQYSCPAASSAWSTIKSPTSNARWAEHLDASRDLFADLDSVSGVPPDDPGFHASFDRYYDNLSARQCHDKPLPCQIGNESNCINQEMCDSVYRLGHWEYSHIYRDDSRSLAASAASMGVWFAELASHLRAAASAAASADVAGHGHAKRIKYFHSLAHDGSMSRVLSVLQADVMIWPGMGAEVVYELWKKTKSSSSSSSSNDDDDDDDDDGETELKLRVLFGGQVLESSNPSLGRMDMIPLGTFLDYVDGLVGENAALVKDICGS